MNEEIIYQEPAKVFQRSDVEIFVAANKLLHWTSGTANAHVQVTVESGWLILSGDVVWEHQRRWIVLVLRQIIGVKGIANKIKLKPTAIFSPVIADINAHIVRLLGESECCLTLDKARAIVILSGVLKTRQEREKIMRAMWCIPGIRYVVDNTLIHSRS